MEVVAGPVQGRLIDKELSLPHNCHLADNVSGGQGGHISKPRVALKGDIKQLLLRPISC